MVQNLIGYYPIADIATFPNTSTTTEYDLNNNSLTKQSVYTYDALDRLIYKKQTISNGYWIDENYSHAYDFPSDPNYSALFNANRLDEVVRVDRTKRPPTYEPSVHQYLYKKEYSNISGHIFENKITEAKNPDFNTIPEITTIDKYDNNANPLQYTKNGSINSMLWDYNGEYVVAEAVNAPYNEIAYTSFETAGYGNFDNYGSNVNTVVPNSTTSNMPPTGNKYYSLITGITKSGLTAGKQYIVSYWTQNASSLTIAGTIGTKGETINGWTYYEHVISPSGSTITISGSGNIDELRLYPKGALITTYTYLPLKGITSKCDANNHISYYEYDAIGRLNLIRDQNKNIIKQFEYKYKQLQ
jgi:hypothetical protein